MNLKKLIVIVGPTGIGKTNFAIELARHLQTEIISADSRQIYQEMNIGTAVPTNLQMAEVPHHFIQSHSIQTPVSAGQFATLCRQKIEQLGGKLETLIMVGGSGLFIQAALENSDEIPPVDPLVRQKLNDEWKSEGLEKLLLKLKEKDPDYFFIVDKHNPMRIIRALEVIETTQIPYSFLRKGRKISWPFEIIKIGLEVPRSLLYERIDHRTDHMIQNGLVEEVKSLYSFKKLTPLKTVGYSEIFEFLEGKFELKTSIGMIKQHTRNYAKRQITWFKKDTTIQWMSPTHDNITEILKNLT